MKMVGIDPLTKVVTPNEWCHRGHWPELAKEYEIKK